MPSARYRESATEELLACVQRRQEGAETIVAIGGFNVDYYGGRFDHDSYR